MFTVFDLENALSEFEFEAGISEKAIERVAYLPNGDWLEITLFATTSAKYARVVIQDMEGEEKTLGQFGGAIRHYLYTSNKASGPIRGRKIITDGWVNSKGYASLVEYIIDNPFYKA